MGEFGVEGLKFRVMGLGYTISEISFFIPQTLNFQPTKASSLKKKNHVKELSKNSLEGVGAEQVFHLREPLWNQFYPSGIIDCSHDARGSFES